MQHKNILEDLYYGNISPWSKSFDHGSKYARCVKIISDNEEKLNSSLNEESLQLLSQLMNAQADITCFNELEHFADGFRLGAEFMLDTFLLPRKSVVSDI